jgi:hypothetical protein
MALVDWQRGDEDRVGPRADSLGLGFFFFHILISAYIIFGWILSPTPALIFYLVLLPALAAQWYVNRGSCVINNIESWLRSGRWRDPKNPEEGGFVLMICQWLFGVRPHPVVVDRLCYATVFILWLLAVSRFSWSVAATAA